MLPTQSRSHRSGTIAIVRDCVEIIAILAAGIWAFYVFIYENRILPSLAQPAITITSTIARTSEYNGTIGVHLEVHVKNTGTVRVYFVGLNTAVLGQRSMLTSSPQPPTLARDDVSQQGFYRLSPPVPVYNSGFITDLGDPGSGRDLPLEPGDEGVLADTVLYVPEGHFDVLNVNVLARFTRDADRAVPTHFKMGKHGTPTFAEPEQPGVVQYAAVVGTLDLHATR